MYHCYLYCSSHLLRQAEMEDPPSEGGDWTALSLVSMH